MPMYCADDGAAPKSASWVMTIDSDVLHVAKAADTRVLLADDSPAVTRELRQLLETIPGVRVVGVADCGVAALDAVREHDPHLLILDVEMPNGSGLHVLDRLPPLPRRPIVLMLSNHAGPAIRDHAIRAGASGFFDKSTELTELLEEIRRLSMEPRRPFVASTPVPATESASWQAAEQMDLLARATNDVVRDWDVTRDVVNWNQWLQPTFGVDPATAPATSRAGWLERVHPDDRTALDAGLESALEGAATTWTAVYRFRRGDESYAHVLDRSYLLRDANLRVVRVVGSMLDITETREAAVAADELNRELELRVAERTRELGAAVRELEAFGYSVSHDLRTPLRALDGFSQALLEDYADRLDDVGRDYLERIRQGSRRMGMLIDDLLGLSRVTRTPMEPVEIDLAAMARSIMADLTTADSGRPVELQAPATLPASGDPRLVRIALHNLLDNACKFTRLTARPRVELGAVERDGVTSYYVADNGVGFDMAHAHKLFGAFQRLHRLDEFEGTGIGLATVQRIIHRHGGWITAKGSPGEGATFEFTLTGTRS